MSLGGFGFFVSFDHHSSYTPKVISDMSNVHLPEKERYPLVGRVHSNWDLFFSSTVVYFIQLGSHVFCHNL